MDINRFIENVNNVDWKKFDDAEYFKYRYDGINSFAQTVPQILIALATVDKESDDLYRLDGRVRFAVGNDHRGTYYPVIREALPFIIEVALYGNHSEAQTCAICVIEDLYFFYPEIYPENDSNELLENELLEFVETTIKDLIAEHRENLLDFASGNQCEKFIGRFLSIVDEKEHSVSGDGDNLEFKQQIL